MRTAIGLVAACMLGCLAAGCAARAPQRAIVATPSPEELPHFTELERIIPARVEIEHRGIDPRLKLVPDIKEPPLTAEEMAAIGETEPLFKILLFGEPTRSPDSRVAPWYGGVTTGAHGYAGAGVAHGPSSSVTGTGSRGGIAVATDTFGSRVTGTGGEAAGVTGVGPRGGVAVGEDRASRVADHARRVDP